MKETRRSGYGLLLGGIGALIFPTGLILLIAGVLVAGTVFKQFRTVTVGYCIGAALVLLLHPIIVVCMIAAVIVFGVIATTWLFFGSEASSPTSIR